MQVERYEPGSSPPLDQIGRLRYGVYVVEMQKDYPEANHSTGTLVDECDAVSTHFVVRDDEGGIWAALRYTELARLSLRRLEMEGLSAIATDSEVMSVSSLSSRLVLAQSVRSRLRALPALFEAIYTYGTLRGSLLNYVHCQGKIAPLFVNVGFQRVAPNFTYQPTGMSHVRLCLQTDAIEPLERVGSRLGAVCRQLCDVTIPPRSDRLLARMRTAMCAQTNRTGVVR